MRLADINKIATIIQSSGIGTVTQRRAIVQRIYDWYNQQRGQEPEPIGHGSLDHTVEITHLRKEG